MISDRFRRFKHKRRLKNAVAEIASRPSSPGAPHGLPGELIVSLTSYPARFGTLALTLGSVLHQSVKPDRVVLWLDEGDCARLPEEVEGLAGLEVRVCPPWRSYKKIVPALLEAPGAHIVTADDDVYYRRDWLAELVRAAQAGARVACHRAHRIVLRPDGSPAPYDSWQRNIGQPERSSLIFVTGVSGAIYSPGVFHADVTRHDLFTSLAQTADDVWLHWMHRLNGVEAQKIGGRAQILEWEGSQAQSLRAYNLGDRGNDAAVAALSAAYGFV